MTVKVQIKSQIFHCRKQFVLGGRHAILGIRGNWRKIRRGLKYSDNLRKAPWVVWPCTVRCRNEIIWMKYHPNLKEISSKLLKKYHPKEGNQVVKKWERKNNITLSNFQRDNLNCLLNNKYFLLCIFFSFISFWCICIIMIFFVKIICCHKVFWFGVTGLSEWMNKRFLAIYLCISLLI